MTKKSAKKTVSTFADLPELIAEETANPAFEASFGDPLPLSIIEPGDEPGEHTMPEPFTAQKVCGELITSLYCLLTDTRLDPLAPQIAWGIRREFARMEASIPTRQAGSRSRSRARGMVMGPRRSSTESILFSMPRRLAAPPIIEPSLMSWRLTLPAWSPTSAEVAGPGTRVPQPGHGGWR